MNRNRVAMAWLLAILCCGVANAQKPIMAVLDAPTKKRIKATILEKASDARTIALARGRKVDRELAEQIGKAPWDIDLYLEVPIQAKSFGYLREKVQIVSIMSPTDIVVQIPKVRTATGVETDGVIAPRLFTTQYTEYYSMWIAGIPTEGLRVRQKLRIEFPMFWNGFKRYPAANGKIGGLYALEAFDLDAIRAELKAEASMKP
jgi:hypothetical protein